VVGWLAGRSAGGREPRGDAREPGANLGRRRWRGGLDLLELQLLIRVVVLVVDEVIVALVVLLVDRDRDIVDVVDVVDVVDAADVVIPPST